MSEPTAAIDPRLRHAREMALNRLVFGVVIGIYFIAGNPGPALLATIPSYIAFGFATFAWLRWRPGKWLGATLFCAILADIVVLSICMELDGRRNAVLFPLYLWTIQGNGFRLGIKALFSATAISFVAFGCVIATTPYWRDQPILALSLLGALVILPAYSSTLIRKLSRARLDAEEASRAKSMFLAAVSHELRTPLNAIVGSVSLIEDTPLNEEQRSLFQAMRAGTQSLLSLIGSVLDFSRAEAGLMPVKQEKLSLAGLMFEIRDLVAIQARMKSLQLSVHIGPEVPSHVVGDRKHLMEILVNLAANAVKFTETGGVCLCVERVAIQPGLKEEGAARLRFEVSDTGIGIAPEALSRIFDVFSQADATILDRFGGTGLGLSISRQLVHQMGGDIGVDSRPGQGSSFWITLDLPEARPPAASLPDEGVSSQDGRPLSGAAGAAVLLCDDPSLVETISMSLRAQGLSVRRVNGLQGVLGAPASRTEGEILFLHRRDPDGDLPGDCALLGRLDPQGTMARILLIHGDAVPLPPAMLKRHFTTTLTLESPPEAWAQICDLAIAGMERPALGSFGSGFAEGIAVRTSEAPASAETRALAGRHLHVLVADDNEINRRVVRKILERSGHRVTLVEDGMQAMDALEADDFDLVLMDVNMPEMNGMETTRLFRLAMPPTPRLPILALTADATAETERKCREAGMDGCITKPVTPARLIAAIEAQLGISPHPERKRPPAADQRVTLLADHPRFPSTLPALDPEVLTELRALGGSGFVGELLESFIIDAKGLIERIDSAVQAQDMTEFRFELHALCSGAANVGAAALRDCATAREIGQATLRAAGGSVVLRLRHELARIEREWGRIAALPEVSSG